MWVYQPYGYVTNRIRGAALPQAGSGALSGTRELAFSRADESGLSLLAQSESSAVGAGKLVPLYQATAQLLTHLTEAQAGGDGHSPPITEWQGGAGGGGGWQSGQSEPEEEPQPEENN